MLFVNHLSYLHNMQNTASLKKRETSRSSHTRSNSVWLLGQTQPLMFTALYTCLATSCQIGLSCVMGHIQIFSTQGSLSVRRDYCVLFSFNWRKDTGIPGFCLQLTLDKFPYLHSYPKVWKATLIWPESNSQSLTLTKSHIKSPAPYQ